MTYEILRWGRIQKSVPPKLSAEQQSCNFSFLNDWCREPVFIWGTAEKLLERGKFHAGGSLANWTYSDKDINAGERRDSFGWAWSALFRIFFEQPTRYFNLIESHKFIDARYFHFLFSSSLSVFLKHIAFGCSFVCSFVRFAETEERPKLRLNELLMLFVELFMFLNGNMSTYVDLAMFKCSLHCFWIDTCCSFFTECLVVFCAWFSHIFLFLRGNFLSWKSEENCGNFLLEFSHQILIWNDKAFSRNVGTLLVQRENFHSEVTFRDHALKEIEENWRKFSDIE